MFLSYKFELVLKIAVHIKLLDVRLNFVVIHNCLREVVLRVRVEWKNRQQTVQGTVFVIM